MRCRSSIAAFGVLAAAACGGATPAPHARLPPRHDNIATDRVPQHCPLAIDVSELLGRHARAFGTAAATQAALPRTMRLHEELGGREGAAELVLDTRAHRWEERIGGVHHATGTDANGAWVLGVAGLPLRLRAGESSAVLFAPWFMRRGYLTDFDPKRDAATCKEDPAGPRVRVSYGLAELGAPEVEFDLTTAAIVEASVAASDGRRGTTQYGPWTAPDPDGVRWPKTMMVGDPAGNRTTYQLTESASGMKCAGVDVKGGDGKTSSDCLAAPKSALEIGWPASGIVRVPMKFYLGELSIRVHTGDREAWALLDSGAGITVVDATTPAGISFVSNLDVNGSGSSQAIRAGLGELPKLRIGDLSFTHLPAASIPIPALDPYGNRRPEVIVGFSVFLGAAVRVDYAKEEIVFARTADALVKPGATSIPLRVLEGKPVADAQVEGVSAPFLVDTGNSGGIDLTKRWASAHGFPGARPTTTLIAKTGAGTDETASTLLRLAKGGLGPIAHDDRLTEIDDGPTTGIIAGLIGNAVFAHCAAVIFDVSNRKLWFESPCDRPTPEAKAGWRLGRRESKDHKDRPWVIDKLVPESAAAQAGLEIGDRLLSVGTVAADADVAKIQPLIEQPDGTKVTVTVDRKGQRKQVVIVLRRLLTSSSRP